MPSGRADSDSGADPRSPESKPHIVRRITSHLGLVTALQEAIKGEKPILFGVVALYSGKGYELEQLLNIVTRLPTKLVEERVERIRKRIPKGENAFEWWVGAQMLKLKPIRLMAKGIPRLGVAGLPRPRFRELLIDFCNDLEAEVQTPLEWAKQAPAGEVLRGQTLEDTLTVMGLCDEPRNVVTQLTRTLPLLLYGLRTSTDIPPTIYKPNYDLTIPKSLLDILNTLKYRESENIFHAWLNAKIAESRESALAAVIFLKATIGAVIGQDVQSLSNLWKPPTAIEGREAEILVQPFVALRNSIAKLQISLRKQPWGDDLQPELKLVERQLELRYGEVFSPAHRTSRVTADRRALTPKSEEFAQFAALAVNEAQNFSSLSDREIAKALIKQAQSAGIENIGPLTTLISNHFPNLVSDVGIEAMKAGFIPFPPRVATNYAIDKLRADPWRDIADMDLSKVVRQGVRVYQICFLPGSFAPWTVGHEDSVLCTIAHFKSLPDRTPNGRMIQRTVVILPIIRTRDVEGYEKSTAQVGPIGIRTGSILLGSGYEFDRSEVMMTTALQPDPTETDMSQRMVITANRIQAQLLSNLAADGRKPDVEIQWFQLMGPDEPAWQNGFKDLAPREKQPERVTRPGGILVTRPGWNDRVISNFPHFATDTGITTIIITTGTHSGSTALREELLKGRIPRALKPTQVEHALHHYGREQAFLRETSFVPDNIVLSVTRVNDNLVRRYSR